jgi:hypothetical protein
MKHLASNDLPRPVAFELEFKPPDTAHTVQFRFAAFGLPMIVAAWRMGIKECRVVSDTHRLDFKWRFV